MEYYIHYECPRCGGDVYDRAFNGVYENEIPVFDLDHFSQHMMTCENDIFKKKQDNDAFITEDDLKKLSESEQEQYYPEECGYQFGTGDIDVLGEDDW